MVWSYSPSSMVPRCPTVPHNPPQHNPYFPRSPLFARRRLDLSFLRPASFPSMMEAAVIPPFERFYSDHRDEVFAVLVRRLGRQRAEDAFQETFLRALRAYAALRHGDHLRAWVLTIARNVAVDSYRREKPTVELEEPIELPRRPAYAELAHLTDALPPTE